MGIGVTSKYSHRVLLLEVVHIKLDLYKKLTEPKVNEMLKRQ